MKTDFNTENTLSSHTARTTTHNLHNTHKLPSQTPPNYSHKQHNPATFENTILYRRGKIITRAITHSPIVVSSRDTAPAFAVLIHYRRYKYPELFALCHTLDEALRLDAIARRVLRSQIKNTVHLNQRVINFDSYNYSYHTRRPASTLVI